MKGRAKKVVRTPKRSISEEPIVFGEVIAAREHRVGRQRVLVQIGTPHRLSADPEFYCPYRFLRGGKATVHRAIGFDSMEALRLVFEAIEVHLGQLAAEAEPAEVTSAQLGLDFSARLAPRKKKRKVTPKRKPSRRAS